MKGNNYGYYENQEEWGRAVLSRLNSHVEARTMQTPAGRYALAIAITTGPNDFSDMLLFNARDWPDESVQDARPWNQNVSFADDRDMALDFVRDGVGDMTECVERVFNMLAWAQTEELHEIADSLTAWMSECDFWQKELEQ